MKISEIINDILKRFDYDRNLWTFRHKYNSGNYKVKAGDIASYKCTSTILAIRVNNRTIPISRIIYFLENNNHDALNKIIHIDKNYFNNDPNNLCEIEDYNDPVELFEYDFETNKLKYKKHTKYFRIGENVSVNMNDNGYETTCVKNNKSYLVHRLVWEVVCGKIPNGLMIDHINRIRNDNRIENLRLVTRAGNAHNMDVTSTLVGASMYRNNNKWQSRICVNGKSIHLGYFDTAEEAHHNYLLAKEKYHDNFSI